MKIFKNIDELTIYDEYGVEYTKTQFLDEELAFMKKTCPGDPWKYQLIFEEEHKFS